MNQRKYRINPPKVHKVGKSEIFKQIDKEINTKVQDNLILDLYVLYIYNCLYSYLGLN